MKVQWTTIFLDRAAHRFDETVEFWAKASGSNLSPWRGDLNEFSTLVPEDGGDAHLKVQRTASDGYAVHIDLHISDVRNAMAECVGFGASVVADQESYAVLESPSGMTFCLVDHPVKGRRQRPVVVGPSETATLVDQVSIDVDPGRLEDEVRFWSSITGWSPLRGRLPEFVPLDRPPAMPIRIMLQARDRPSGSTTGHIDIACEDRPAAVVDHEILGAKVDAVYRYWTVMTDPSGAEYCLTSRNPDTGLLGPETVDEGDKILD